MDKNINMDTFLPICTTCFDFTTDGVRRERRTVVIAPIVIHEIDAHTKQVSWACSLGRYCAGECHYAKKKADMEDLRPVEYLGHLDR